MIKILEYDKAEKSEIFKRSEYLADVAERVGRIISEVRERQDEALFELTEKFDGVRLDSLEVSAEEISSAIAQTDERFLSVLEKAAKNIREFHEKQKREGFEIKREGGAVLGQKITPVERAGLYVPGGSAAYPSTVLMDCIPAKIAGCGLVIMTTPPGKDGKIDKHILAAAAAAKVDKIYKIGGAQAVAAMAFGTQTVPKVDKIVGPGNAYVAEAKKQVFGEVSIDMIAGPSEILIIADEKTDPVYAAADMLSQAEHDKNASAVLITDSRQLAKKVAEEIEIQLEKLERRQIAGASIEDNGKIIITSDLKEAVELANLLAPEHLEVCTEKPFEYLKEIKNAGSVFLGRYCPEALGDYIAGPNHTLPTSGTARFSNPLSVDDFVKKTQYIYFDKAGFEELADDVEYFAEKEGLTAHARSVSVRREDKA